jgi:hypothetical protein
MNSPYNPGLALGNEAQARALRAVAEAGANAPIDVMAS